MLFERLKQTIWLWVAFVASVVISLVHDFCYGIGQSAFARSRRAVSAVGIVMMIVGAYIAGILLPTAIVALSNATAYSGANSNVITIATVLLPIIIIIGLALRFLKR